LKTPNGAHGVKMANFHFTMTSVLCYIFNERCFKRKGRKRLSKKIMIIINIDMSIIFSILPYSK